MSKQAMNQLLRSLEGLGYIVRSDAPDEGRTRIVRFTKRGRAAYSKSTTYSATSSANGALSLGPRISLSSKNCSPASGRAR